jgi:hypothetical protein
MKQVVPAPALKQKRVAPADDWKILDEFREAFKDVPPEEIEREVAAAIAQGREEMRAQSGTLDKSALRRR